MPERDWERLGALSEGWTARVLGVSPEGFGLLGAQQEPSEGDLLARLKARRARLSRVGAGSLTTVWEGPGWVQALDCSGAVGALLVATLRPSGTGSDYHLWVSTDAGHTWEARGPVRASSVTQVLAVGERELWVLGVGDLGHSGDGGATWTEVHREGVRNPRLERLQIGRAHV